MQNTTKVLFSGALALGMVALMISAIVMPVAAYQYTYESKYSPVISDTDRMTYAGHVFGNLKSGRALTGGDIFIIHKNGTPESSNTTERFNPDGTYDGYLPAGEYTITLPQGTGSAAGVYTEDAGFVGNLHPEVATIKVAAGKDSYFTFIGNSIPTQSTPEAEPSDDVTIVGVTYGGETVSHVVHYEAVTHMDYQAGHVHAKKVNGYGQFDFVYLGHKYKIVGNSHEAAFMVYGSFGMPAQMVTIVDSPAYDQTVIDYQGGYSQPVAEVQSVVDQGIMSFMFNNQPTVGGIFREDGNDLLAEIEDPAPGIVKHISITYNDGTGTGDKTIEAEEREVITL